MRSKSESVFRAIVGVKLVSQCFKRLAGHFLRWNCLWGPGGGKNPWFFPPPSHFNVLEKNMCPMILIFFRACLCVSGGQKIILYDKYIMPRKFSNSR